MSGNAHSDAAAVLLLGICLILCAAWLYGASPASWAIPSWACPAVVAALYLAVALGLERLSPRAAGLWSLMLGGHMLYAALMSLAVQALRPGPADISLALDFALRNAPACLLQVSFVVPAAAGLIWPALAGRPPGTQPQREIVAGATDARQLLTSILVLDSTRGVDPCLALRDLATKARELLAEDGQAPVGRIPELPGEPVEAHVVAEGVNDGESA